MAKTFTITTTVTVDEDGQVVGQSRAQTVATAVTPPTSADFQLGDTVDINGTMFVGTGTVIRKDANGDVACRTSDGRKIRYSAADLAAGVLSK